MRFNAPVLRHCVFAFLACGSLSTPAVAQTQEQFGLWESDLLPAPACSGPAVPTLFQRVGDFALRVIEGRDQNFADPVSHMEQLRVPDGMVAVTMDPRHESPYLYVLLEPDIDETLPFWFRIYCKSDLRSAALDVLLPGVFSGADGAVVVGTELDTVAGYEVQYVRPDTAAEFPGAAFAVQLGDRSVLLWTLGARGSRLKLLDLLSPVSGITLGWDRQGLRLTYVTDQFLLGTWAVNQFGAVPTLVALAPQAGASAARTHLFDERDKIFVFAAERGLVQFTDEGGSSAELYSFDASGDRLWSWDWFHSADGLSSAVMALYGDKVGTAHSLHVRVIWLDGTRPRSYEFEVSSVIDEGATDVRGVVRASGRAFATEDEPFSALDMIFAYNVGGKAKVKAVSAERVAAVWELVERSVTELEEQIALDQIQILSHNGRRDRAVFHRSRPGDRGPIAFNMSFPE